MISLYFPIPIPINSFLFFATFTEARNCTERAWNAKSIRIRTEFYFRWAEIKEQFKTARTLTHSHPQKTEICRQCAIPPFAMHFNKSFEKMRMISALICAIALLKASPARAACVWEETYGGKQYYIKCDDAQLDASVPPIPEDALGACIEQVNGIVPQGLFANRVLKLV